jgi:heptosyltransferase-2
MRLGVFLPNWVGDVVMATPAVRALRKVVGEDGTLVGVMRPYVVDVLAGTDWLDEAVLYSKRAPHGVLAGRLSDQAGAGQASPPTVYEQLRAAKLDSIVLLTNSLRTGWMAWRSGARERIGMVGNLRTSLLTTKVYPPRKGRRAAPLPTIDGYLQVAYAAGAAPEPPTLELATTSDDEAAADAAWQRLNLRRQERVAVINTGGAFGAAKDWPPTHFGKLAKRLAVEHEMHVVFNCGPAERLAVRAIAETVGHPRVHSLAEEPQLPLGLTKAVIRRAALLVTTDSGPRYFGVAFGVPTVTLFGPTNPRLVPTYSRDETVVSLGIECQPCMERSCPLGHHRCMRDLTVDRVYAAVEAALATAGAGHMRVA